MIAVIRGPYCTGPSRPAGAAAPVVPAPAAARDELVLDDPHRGWQVEHLAALHPGTGRPARPAPHRPQQPGSWRSSRSGRATSANVDPGCPCCPPGLRPVFFRSDRGDGLPSPSPEGGREELRGVCLSRASSSAIRSRACASSSTARASAACDSASSARSEATSAASTSSPEPASRQAHPDATTTQDRLPRDPALSRCPAPAQ